MLRKITRAAAFLAAAGAVACSPAPPPSSAAPADDSSRTVWQLSPFSMLKQGHYDGVMTVDEVRRHGDLGLAAADQLNGEMVMVDGQFYQFLASGQVVQPPADMRLPFAEVTTWTGGRDVPVAPGQTLATTAPPSGSGAFYAVRMEGTWDTVIVRTFHRQTRPYPPLDTAVHHQAVDTLVNVRGTMAGFWQPAYAQEISIPGYHVHVITDDHARGGHVLSFRARSVRMQLSERPDFAVHVPSAP